MTITPATVTIYHVANTFINAITIVVALLDIIINLIHTFIYFVVDIAVILCQSRAGGINGSEGIIYKVLICIFLLGDAGFKSGCFPTRD